MLDQLLRWGYFPHELPPLFTTEHFAAAIQNGIQQLPAGMVSAQAPWTKPVTHNLARIGGLRRRLSVPNPVSFFRLSKTFDAHSGALLAAWSQSAFSQTKPQLHPSGPRALWEPNAVRSHARTTIRVGARYLLKTDIAQFYPSIYSHSIPWALHTKAIAKAQMNNAHLPGNQIDKELRAGHNGQTKGITIGPDTSLGIGELILSPIDVELRRQGRMLGGTRFIDDMEFTFSTLADAEVSLKVLESLLHGFELDLNAKKTELIELPDSIDSLFVSILRGRAPQGGTTSIASWLDYFNTAFDLAKKYRSDGVLRYAIASLQGHAIHQAVWPIAQALLWQCVSLDPGCLRFVIDVLLFNTRVLQLLQLDAQMAATALDSLISTSAPVGHGSEVVWALWAAMLFNLQVSQSANNAIVSMDDCFVAAAYFVAGQRGNLVNPLQSQLWSSWVIPAAFTDDHWLFAYEAHRHAWLQPAALTAANIPSDANAAFLLAHGVSFIDATRIATYRPSAGLGSGGGYTA